METQDTYLIRRDPTDSKSAIGCIDLCESEDDGGWYAHEYDFTRKDNSTRTSSKIYRDRQELVKALDLGIHRWKKWD